MNRDISTAHSPGELNGMNQEEVQRIWISLRRCRRYLDFPWKVSEIGRIIGSPRDAKVVEVAGRRAARVLPDKLEFCIRVSPSREVIHQRIAGREYMNSYPHILVKLPCMEYSYDLLDVRDVFFFIYPSELLEAFRRMGLIDDVLCWNIQLSPEVSGLLRKLRDMMERAVEFSMADKIDLVVFQLLEELYFQKKNRAGMNDELSSRFERLVSYIQLHAADNLSIPQIAAEYGFSRSSFFRYWGRSFDVSPARYVLMLRLKEARRLLLETSRNIADIAYSLHFCDATYFCAAFRREFNITPAAFRHSAAEADSFH